MSEDAAIAQAAPTKLNERQPAGKLGWKWADQGREGGSLDLVSASALLGL